MTTTTPTPRPPEVNNGVTTTWVPFTTPGPAAASDCSLQAYRVPGGTDVMAFDPSYAANNTDSKATQCLPSEVIKIWQAEQSNTGSTKSSLGPFNCPSLYVSAATASVNAISTIVACCPSYREDSKCVSTVAPGQALVVNNLSGVVPEPTNSASGLTVTGYMITGYIFADDAVVPLATITTAPSATALINAASSLGISSAPTSSTTAAAAAATSSHGLSTGAKVGITISVVFTVITAVVLLAGLHIRRRRTRQQGGGGRRHEPTIMEGQPLSPEQLKPQPQKPPQPQMKQQDPMAILQLALSPDTIGAFGPRAQPRAKPHNESGPHEMEVQEKFEMAAAEVDGSTSTDTHNTDQSGEGVRQAEQKSRVGAGYGYGERGNPTDTRGGRSNNVVAIPAPTDRSDGARNNFGRTTPDISGRANRSVTPDSSVINSSFGRITPDTFGAGNNNSPAARRTTDRLGNAHGRRPPDRQGVRSNHGRTTSAAARDARTDDPSGCISPISSTERSFLDLSEAEST